MPTLMNDNLLINFSAGKPGFDSFLLKESYYNKGLAQHDSVKNRFNNIDALNQLKISRSDFYSLLIAGIEYSVSGLTWSTTETVENSKNLYGKHDSFGGIDIDVIQAVSTGIIDLEDGRSVINQEVTYFFTLDGKGVVKRVRVTLNDNPAITNVIQTARILNFLGANSVTGSRFNLDSYYFGTRFIGFDYDDIADYNSDWTTDGGLTVTVARKNVYPNLLPDFNDPGWQDIATVIGSDTLDLNAGDESFITKLNAYPDERKHYLIFTVQNLIGTLQVSFSMVRNAIDTVTTDDLQVLNITADGEYQLEFPAGFGYAWLYVKFNQLTGSSRVFQPSVNYRGLDYIYAAPDDSYPANFNMRNCVRIQSADPSGEMITHIFSSSVKVADGGGVMVGILSLDNTNITDGAFKIGFQKPDNSWVDSGDINMFVDYNEVFGQDTASQFNQWEDGLFGISIPAGVDEIKAIRIEFITTNAIDWLLDYFAILNWDNADNSIGSDDRRNFGMAVEGIRAREFHLRGSHGSVYPNDTTITGERTHINTGFTRSGTTRLTFSNASSISSVYILLDAISSFAWASLTDKGYELVIDMSEDPNFVYPDEVKNTRTGDTYRVKTISGSDIIVDTANKEHDEGDLIQVRYKSKFELPGSGYSLGSSGLITWQPELKGFEDDRVYVDYAVPVRNDDVVGLVHTSSNHTSNTMRCLRLGLDVSAPLIANYDIMTFSDSNNSKGESRFIYYPTKTAIGDSLYSEVQGVQDMIEDMRVLSRDDPLEPLPRNYGLIPHVAFGGEQIAAEPIQYLIQTRQKLTAAGADNAVVSAGSLSFLRDRDLNSWWEWGGSLLDNGIDYLLATRNMLRRNLSESEVSNHINRHRYLFEVTTFAYEHNRRYRNQAAVDYKGEEKYKRVWYYQNPEGLYTSRVHAWDDFQESYYENVSVGNSGLDSFGEGSDPGGTADYEFRYHYTLVIPAFWSIVTPNSDWGLTEDTIYNKMARRLDYLCRNYDTDGVIISEMIHYRQSFSANDLTLFKAWSVAQGHGVQNDWPRWHSNNWADPDDSNLAWPWMRYQTKKFLTEMATIVHGHNKLLGVNVLAQNIFSITNHNNPVWNSYTQTYNAQYNSWHVNTLDFSLDRYGTNYAELLKEDIIDIMYVWLYYRYSPFGKQAVFDFMEEFDQYKERMFLTVGLFPKEDPPKECEVVQLLKTLLSAGWNVVYAGYPPMLIQDSRWAGVWSKIKGYVPTVDYDEDEQEIIVDPAQSVDIPFYARF